MTIQRYLQAHFCSAIAYATVAVMFLAVEQVKHLFELPPWELLIRSPMMLGSFAGIAALGALYVFGAWWIVPPHPPASPEPPEIPAGIVPRLRFSARIFRLWCIGVLQHIERNLASGRRWLVPFFIVAGAALALVALHEPKWPVVGTHPARAAFSWLFFLWAMWWLVNPGPRQATYLGHMMFRALVALSLFNLIGELLWVLAIHGIGMSFRIYSLWGMMHISFCVVIVGRMADYWNRLSVLPVRPILLVVLVIAAGVHPSTIVGHPEPWSRVFVPSPTTATATTDEGVTWASWKADDVEDRWLQQLAERLEALPHRDKPVVLVAASGGGSRAALFTALVFEQLRRWTPQTSSPDPAHAPRLVEDPHARAHLADQILLISSVSGGTLASSEYVARAIAGSVEGFPAIAEPTTCFEPEVRWRMRRQIEEIAGWDEKLQRRAYGDDGPDYIRQARSTCDGTSRLWFHQSEFIDHVSTDFMAPLLRGALFPGQERGKGVQAFWRDQLSCPSCPLTHSNVDSHLMAPEQRRRVPLLIANVTEIDRGSSLLVGFPPLPPFFFAGKYARFHAFPCRDLTNVGPPDSEFTRLDLTESSRLSANFPWGFSTAQLARGSDLDTGHLIDGGVFDNTGVATIRYVFERLHDWSEAYAKEGKDAGPSAQLAAQIMGKLRRRGVVLIEIDSGAKQEPSRGVATLLPGIFGPVTALENVSYTGADRVAQEHIRRLKKIFAGPSISTTLERLRYDVADELLRRVDRDFGFKLEDGNLTMFHSLRITCNHEENVMTAWALAPSDKAKVFVQFLLERPKAAERIAQLIDVQARTAPLIERFETPPRPPERYATDELVAMYYDLLKFNSATQFDLRKEDLQQARTFASLRGEVDQAKVLNEAAPAAPSDRSMTALDLPPSFSPAGEAENVAGPSRITVPTAVPAPPAPPTWKQFQRSPSAKLRQTSSDLKRPLTP